MKYKLIKKELAASKIVASHIPCYLYMQLAKLKGYIIPAGHLPHDKDTKNALKRYTETNGDFQRIPYHESSKSKRERLTGSPKYVYKPKEDYAAKSQEFLISREWRELRYLVLKERGARCECCGATAKTGAVIHVDHIKSRFKHPELALSKHNLQILCADCNIGKGWRDQTDWRTNLP